MDNFVVTIARQYGSGGKTVGQMLAKDLGIDCYDREILRMASDDSGLNLQMFGNPDERRRNTFLFLEIKKAFTKEICISREVRNSFQTKIFSTIRQRF